MLLVVFALVMLDVALKIFFSGIFQMLSCGNEGCLYSYFPIVGERFGIQLVYNSGIAFGLPLTGTLLKILTFAIFVGLVYYYVNYEYSKHQKVIDIAFVLIFAGGVPHLYERIFMGRVVDFFALKYFAIFNTADIFITV